MNNVKGVTEVPLDVFGGLNSDIQATDLPQGLSPDCSDVAFLPGSVFTRPSLKRLSTIGSTAQCVYTKTFLKPDGTLSQLTFMSDGKMYQDGIQFGQTQPGNRFFSANAFGKMFIAISDGLYGADVPLQFTPEGFLDRVSQDGPGAGPTVQNYSLPAITLTSGSTGISIAITDATPINLQQVQTGGGYDDGSGYIPPQYEFYYTSILFETATDHGLVVGQAVLIAGNSLYSLGTVTVSAVDSTTSFEVVYYQQSATVGTGGNATPINPLLLRTNNSVKAITSIPHNLRAGYKITVSGVPDDTQNISQIVVDNETNPGLGTVTTTGAHGFIPGEEVTISGIQPAAVGGGISSWNITSGVLSMTTANPHRLNAGDAIIWSVNGGQLVSANINVILSPTQISILVPGIGNASGSTNATLTVPFPLPSGSLVDIVSVPTPTTFQFSINSPNATFTTGTLSFAWNGTFYVTSVPSPNSLIYSQLGPNNSLQSGSGLITPVGQIEAGTHSVVQIFLTRTGYLTIPSPPVSFTASGGQYLLITNAAKGPSNVVARWFGIAGANGGRYFVIPVPPRDPAGQFLIGTSTVIPDNTTDSAILDFTDVSLFAGLGIDIPGNNLFRQQVLGPCLGFYMYRSRLFSWGERNKVQLFRNMGFEGGIISSAPNKPLGWTVSGSDGILTNGDYGLGWQATTATITQTAFKNQNGTNILDSNTQFSYRAWVNGSSIATLNSASTGYTSTAIITANGAWVEARFSLKTPVVIPSDLVLTISQSGTTTVDEIEIIYSNNPYILAAKGSYINNPEAIDGVTSIIGPAGDPHPIFGMEERKDILCMLTAGPEGSLYETEQTVSEEPNGWDVRHRASKCGLISVWGATKFEDWFCWTSDTGLRIFDGANVDKMSQEVQPWWSSLNPAAKQFTVLANDPYTRRIYIAGAVNSASVPNNTYVLDYRDLNTASQLANAGTLHVGYTGKVVTTDLTRKWSPWSMTMNYIGLVTRTPGQSVMAFCGGTGSSINDPLHSSVYTLNEGAVDGIDDDYGPFWQNCHYASYFMVGAEEAQQLQLGKHRLLHVFMTLNITGLGAVYVVPQLDRLGNEGTPTRVVAVTESLERDLEFALNNASERISYDIRCQPSGPQPAPPTAQSGWRLSLLVLAVKTHPFSPLRGKNF